MKKKMILTTFMLIAIFSLIACGSRDSKKSYEVDMTQCIKDLKEGLVLEPDYSFVNDYSIDVKGNELTVSIVVSDSADPEKALDFADTVIRQLNLYAQMQDSSIESSSKDYYGGLYKQYTTLVGVAPQSKIQEQDKWLVYGSIGSGKVMLKLNKNYK